MSKDKYYQLIAIMNEDVTSESFISLHGGNLGDYLKKDIVINIEFEAIKPQIKNNFFLQ